MARIVTHKPDHPARENEVSYSAAQVKADFAASLEPAPKLVPRKNPTYLFEEGPISVLCEYVVLNPWFWKEEDEPQVQIVKAWLDGGGRDQVEVSTSFFSGRALLSMEAEISNEVNQEGHDDF